MGELVLLLLIVLVGGALVLGIRKASQASKQRELETREAELAPVRTLVFEDVTVLGEELQALDADVAGSELDAGGRADYQRALDAYESAKLAADRLTSPDDVKHVTEILDDGRYAMACVRARAAGEPLPTRRPPCFFDPRHGLSVEDVAFASPGGAERDVPACALDAERVKAGAEPDSRKVLVGAQRVPYWQGGRAYEPYAAGYFAAFAPMQWMFMGMMFSGALGGWGDGGAGDFGGDGGGGDFGGDGGGFGDGGGDGGFGGWEGGGSADAGGGWFDGDFGGGFDF